MRAWLVLHMIEIADGFDLILQKKERKGNAYKQIDCVSLFLECLALQWVDLYFWNGIQKC